MTMKRTDRKIVNNFRVRMRCEVHRCNNRAEYGIGKPGFPATWKNICKECLEKIVEDASVILGNERILQIMGLEYDVIDDTGNGGEIDPNTNTNPNTNPKIPTEDGGEDKGGESKADTDPGTGTDSKEGSETDKDKDDDDEDAGIITPINATKTVISEEKALVEKKAGPAKAPQKRGKSAKRAKGR